MHTIPEAFFCATLAGLWPSTLWISKKTKKRYQYYKIFNITVLCLLVISQSIALLYLTENIHELIESLYVFLTATNACVKCANILLKRSEFIKLTNMFLEVKCKPTDLAEKEICERYNWMCRWIIISICFFGQLTVISYVMKPLFFIHSNYALPARAWLPYNINSSLTFWPTFLHQAVGSHVIAAWNVSMDGLAVSFMLQICCQLHLISHRLKSLPRIVKAKGWPTDRFSRQFEINFIKRCVLHHIYIFNLVGKFNRLFAPNIIIQYFSSGLTIALTIYEVTMNKSDILTCITTAIYLMSMVIELGLYCWFGNEITLKGLQINDCIRQEEWFKLHPRTVKCLKIVMLQSSSPILVAYGPFVTLSTAAYMNVLQVSYSAYNFLIKVH